jgi:hypothetical protein
VTAVPNAANAERTPIGRRLWPWLGVSLLAHAIFFVWVVTFQWSAMVRFVADEDRRVDVVAVVIPPSPPLEVQRPPDPEIDRPDLGTPPARRTPAEEAELRPSPEVPPALGLEPFDPRQLERLAREIERQQRLEASQGVPGGSFRDCSMLTPERRLLEPACDGLLLAYTGRPDVPVALVAPDSEIQRAINAAQDTARASTERARRETREGDAIRNDADDRFGPRPWER